MANNKISASKKEIYTKLLDIAEKYTDIQDTNYLTSGLFGYMTESFAMAMRDCAYHSEMAYNEHFLNKAVIPESVYNIAKQFNVEVQSAIPSYADVDFIIPYERVNEYLDENNELVLDRRDPIIAGDYYFSLEHSLVIRKVDDNNGAGFHYIAFYRDVNKEAQFQGVSTEYQIFNADSTDNTSSRLTVKKTSDGNLIVNARIYQYKQEKFVTQITSSSVLNRVLHYEFNDSFCGASLYYEDIFGIQRQINLVYSDSNVNTTSKKAFYNLNSENQLDILFKVGTTYFMPTENSKLTVFIYSTKGRAVPQNYTEDAIMRISDRDLQALPLVIQFNPTNIIGGKNAPTLNEIKTTIIDAISTRNTISTKSDLDKYFNILTALIDTINNGRVIFRKTRDDIIKRVYNSYLLLRDNTNEYGNIETNGYLSSCIPTNTITVKVNEPVSNAPEESNYNAKYINAQFIPCSSYSLENGVPTYTMASDATTDDYYICPFKIVYQTSPVHYLKYIYEQVDQTAKLSYLDIDTTTNVNIAVPETNRSSELYMVPEDFNIYRGFVNSGNSSFNTSNQYELTFSFRTDKDFTTETVSGSPKILFLNANSEQIEFTFSDITSFEWTSELIDADNSIYLTKLILKLEVANDSNPYILDYDQIQVRSNSADNPEGVSSKITNLKLDLSQLTIADSRLHSYAVYNTPITFYTHMDTIMQSDFSVSDGVVTIKEVPVVHSSLFNGTEEYTNTENRKNGFISQLFTYINILKENLKRLENSTYFNLKFFNTYGPALLSDTGYTNIKLELQIKLISSIVTDYDAVAKEKLKTEIRGYIRKTIDRMNLNGHISISDLISLLTNPNTYGNYIDHITFVGLNNTFDQYVTVGEEDPEHKMLTIPPEWLNIQPEDITNITFAND